MRREVLKNSHENGRRGKVYVGETLEQAIEDFNSHSPSGEETIPHLPFSGIAYSYRVRKAAGGELEASDVLQRYYGKYTLQEIEQLFSKRKHELQNELKRMMGALAGRFEHLHTPKCLWGSHEAIKTKLVNKKSATVRSKRDDPREKAIRNGIDAEPSAHDKEKRETNRARVERMIAARKEKYKHRRNSSSMHLNLLIEDESCASHGEHESSVVSLSRHEVTEEQTYVQLGRKRRLQKPILDDRSTQQQRLKRHKQTRKFGSRQLESSNSICTSLSDRYELRGNPLLSDNYSDEGTDDENQSSVREIVTLKTSINTVRKAISAERKEHHSTETSDAVRHEDDIIEKASEIKKIKPAVKKPRPSLLRAAATEEKSSKGLLTEINRKRRKGQHVAHSKHSKYGATSKYD